MSTKQQPDMMMYWQMGTTITTMIYNKKRDEETQKKRRICCQSLFNSTNELSRESGFQWRGDTTQHKSALSIAIRRHQLSAIGHRPYKIIQTNLCLIVKRYALMLSINSISKLPQNFFSHCRLLFSSMKFQDLWYEH